MKKITYILTIIISLALIITTLVVLMDGPGNFSFDAEAFLTLDNSRVENPQADEFCLQEPGSIPKLYNSFLYLPGRH